MTTMLEANECENLSMSYRRHALLAATPLLLFGILVGGITLFLLAIGGPSQVVSVAKGAFWHNLALVVGVLTITCLFAAAVAAMRRQLPVWSYTWIGAGMTGLVVALNLVIEDRDFVISPVIDTALLALFLLSALVTFGTAVVRGWQHSGLFSLGVCSTVGLSLCFFGIAGPFQFGLGLLAVLLGGAESLLAYAYVCRKSAVRVAALICVGAVTVGVAWIVEWLFRSAHPSRSISQFWSLTALLMMVLIGGTFAGVPGRLIYRVFRQMHERRRRKS